jgi:acyl carrier protein
MNMSNTGNLRKIESWLIGVCQELGLWVNDADSDFFEAGGTSLTAIKLISEVEDNFGEDALPPDDLFAQSSVREIALSIQNNSQRLNALHEA